VKDISLIILKEIHMICQLKREQFLNTNIDSIWDFASNPYNLEKITPEYMSFKITTPDLNHKIHPGMMIEYKVSPILGIPINWLTEITHIQDKIFFIDEQRSGPYKLWHHEHFFIKKNNGIIMKDIVTYIPPFSIIGTIANKVFIKKQLNEIFDYREAKIDQLFN
tara:strand:+ start:568 stop:1062 length:495 start_codon:yes stop_codon:yes gene_type:complete